VVPLRRRRDAEPAGRAHLRLVTEPDGAAREADGDGRGAGGDGRGPGGAAEAVAVHAAHLGDAEQRLLINAIEAGSPVRIDYTTAGGTPSTRVIEPVQLDRHLLTAWCHLRDEDRVFALDRIDAVAPA
jgi:predicted DNA-binding transcriptional regulator YafY